MMLWMYREKEDTRGFSFEDYIISVTEMILDERERERCGFEYLRCIVTLYLWFSTNFPARVHNDTHFQLPAAGLTKFPERSNRRPAQAEIFE